MVKLGHIDYLNCIPVHGAIILGKVPFNGTILSGNPAKLNRLLFKGEIDISPSSSVEIINGYKILPNLSISSKKEVKSIILVTKKTLDKINDGLFYLTSHSATSVLLLKIILREFLNVKASYKVFSPTNHTLDQLIKASEGVLYIGDDALRLKQNVNKNECKDLYYYDLAELWYAETKLPFTFALWQVSKNFKNSSELKETYDTLVASYNFFKDNKTYLASSFSDKFKISVKDILDYWDALSFELTEIHIKSLNLYFNLAIKNGFIKHTPKIEPIDF